MTEKNVLKRFWLQIASGVAILIVAGVGPALGIGIISVEQVRENTQNIEVIQDEQKEFIRKGDNNGIHNMLFENIKQNTERSQVLEKKVDDNQQYIIEELSEIKTIIINKH